MIRLHIRGYFSTGRSPKFIPCRLVELVELSVTCESCLTAIDVAITFNMPSPVGEGGSRRLTDEVSLTQANSSSTTTVVPLLPQEKAI